MLPEVLAFLKTQRVSVFAIEMMDGSPHGATVHFAHVETPPAFIFLTEKRYRKSEPLQGRAESRATVVIGFEEGPNSRTLQMDGIARVVASGDSNLVDTYLEKYPGAKSKFDAEKDFFFMFTPSWWRFTDWTKPEGKTTYLSDGSVTIESKVQQLKVS